MMTHDQLAFAVSKLYPHLVRWKGLKAPFLRRGEQALRTANRRRAYFPFGSCISLTPAHWSKTNRRNKSR